MKRSIAWLCLFILGGSPWLLAQELDDPTRPLVSQGTEVGASGQETLKLESILISDVRKMAVINGVVIVQGQSVNGIKVNKIRPGKVEVQYQGNDEILVLTPRVRAASDKTRTSYR